MFDPVPTVYLHFGYLSATTAFLQSERNSQHAIPNASSDENLENACVETGPHLKLGLRFSLQKTKERVLTRLLLIVNGHAM